MDRHQHVVMRRSPHINEIYTQWWNTIDATYKFTTHQFNTTWNGTSLHRQKMLHPFYSKAMRSVRSLFFCSATPKPISKRETHKVKNVHNFLFFLSLSSTIHIVSPYKHTKKNITFIYWISHQWTFLSLMHFRVILAISFFCCRLFVWNPGEITFDEHMYTFAAYIK